MDVTLASVQPLRATEECSGTHYDFAPFFVRGVEELAVAIFYFGDDIYFLRDKDIPFLSISGTDLCNDKHNFFLSP
jgi:hypothetical protein